jgi:hypothetical protein
MNLPHNCRIITIGDGDLSFSLALSKRNEVAEVCATVLDSEHELRGKYQHNAINELKNAGHKVLFGVDITKPELIKNRSPQEFDLAIFQFPLVPNAGPRRPGQSWHQGAGSNLLNRQLLRAFLLNSAELLLAPEGARLCYVTSKDVKPYCDWNIESLGEPKPNEVAALKYVGKMPFNPGEFPGYRVRNVDRDKQVKSTAAITYVWTDNPQSAGNLDLTEPKTDMPRYCRLCDIGPVPDEQDWQNQ